MLAAVMLVQIRHFSAAGVASDATSAAGAAARTIAVRGCCKDRVQAAAATPAAVLQGPNSAEGTREREDLKFGAFKRLTTFVCLCVDAAGLCSAGALRCAMLAVQYRPTHAQADQSYTATVMLT